ncbi:NADH-quinone oxidoreductase subunit NuoF family protein [Wenjunlia tyrosinilytica]|uniref:Oxidoreductase n=1 Tax=Wenjunlia tyrosinilytica TaxID=1544741 RepID=A0A917ZWH3_9ACTN|nr:NADH-quinone oxidoreductase subunit NuoF family protein [Wenjunlia tyrosinilytica]GGO95907.1 oxidoreductase [Wenjunlia tyrosinilytica]
MNVAPPRVLAVGLPRLLAGLEFTDRLDRVGHLTTHGTLPALRTEDVIALAEDIDLRGRGGAGFPFARKVRAVVESARRGDGRTAVVINGSEGEPACRKDETLLRRSPHLVLDGALLAAEALGSQEVVIGVTQPYVERSVSEALAERGPLGRSVRVEMLPERFVTGEGTALTRGLNTGITLPPGRKVRTCDSGLRGLPTLLSNTETFTQLAIAARLGALGYRTTGLPDEPGTVLLTIMGQIVIEAPTGVPISHILNMCGMTTGQGVLIGGYHGKWIDGTSAQLASISRESLGAFGGVLGAGAILPLPESVCPLGESARVLRWLAGETAGQCGPCWRGLPALADHFEELAYAGGRSAFDGVNAYMEAVKGRGACSHPDGTARFALSSLEVFSEDVAEHAYGRGCGRPVRGLLPLENGVGAPERKALPAGPSSRTEESTERLVVDWTLCEGHGLCADVLPDVVSLGTDGYPASASMPLPGHLRQQARRAIRRCPALALRLER